MAKGFRVQFQRGLRGRELASPRFALDEQHPATIGQNGEIWFAQRAVRAFRHAAMQRNPDALPAQVENLVMEARLARGTGFRAVWKRWPSARTEEMRIEPAQRVIRNDLFEIHTGASGNFCQLFLANTSIVALAWLKLTSVL